MRIITCLLYKELNNQKLDSEHFICMAVKLFSFKFNTGNNVAILITSTDLFRIIKPCFYERRPCFTRNYQHILWPQSWKRITTSENILHSLSFILLRFRQQFGKLTKLLSISNPLYIGIHF